MKRIVLGAVAGAGLAAPAMASAAPATPDWSGFYAGVNAGGDWSSGRQSVQDGVDQTSGVFVPGRGVVIVPGTTVPFPNPAISDARRTSGLVGGQVGWSAQTGDWVFGAEGDILTGDQAAKATVTASIPVTAISPSATTTDTRSIKSDYAWSFRARVGFAWDRFLVYGTGGVAGANLNYAGVGVYASAGGQGALCAPAVCPGSVTTVSNPFTNTTAGSGSTMRIGWTAGVGGEASLSRRVSIGVEYRHSDFGSQNVMLPTRNVQVALPVYTAPAGVSTADASPARLVFGPSRVSFSNDLVTARLNFHF